MNERGRVLERPRWWTPLFVLAMAAVLCATTVVDAGKEQKSADIDCGGHKGKVSVNTGVHFREGEANYRNGISLKYKGTAVGDCCWVQTIWREVVVTYKAAAGASPRTVRKEGTIRTTGGSYKLTTDPSKPVYNPDSGSATSPCYDAAFSSITDGDSKTMYDQPGSAIDRFAAAEKTDATVDKIESIAHFDAYLVCGGKVCAKVSWTSTYTWSGGAGTGPTYGVSDVDKSGNPPNDEQKKAINDKYPGQTVLK